jgi:hypothetical protein
MWLCGAIVWTMNAAREMNNVWYWMAVGVSFVLSFIHARAFDKQIKK